MSFGSIAPMLKMAPRPRPSSAPNLRSFKCARASETEMGLDSVSGQESFGEEMWPLKGLASSESDFELIPEDTEEVEVDHPHHCGQAPVSHGSGKHCPHPLPAAWRVRQFTSRFMGRRRGGKRQSGKVRFSRRRRTDLNDDKAY